MPVIEVNGRGVHYQEFNKGARETIVLIHGMLGNLSVYYFRIAPILAADYHVVLYDLKSHGMSERAAEGYDLVSMAGELAALLDELGLRRVHLGGYSFGALIALKAAALYPSRVKRLIVVEGPDPSDKEPLRVMTEYSREAFDQFVNDSGISFGPRQRERLHRMYAYIFQGTTVREDMRKEHDFFYGEELSRVTHKTLLIYGRASDCAEASCVLENKLPDARLVLIEGDHNVPVQQPAAVAELIRDWCRETRRFLFVVPPLFGHVNPTLGVGAELLKRGHAVAWASLDPALESMLPAGGELLLIKEEAEKEHRGRISEKNVYGIESIKFLYDDVLIPLNRHMYGGILRCVESFKPDVCINDHQVFSGAIAARQSGIAYATSVTAPAAVRMREDLPGVHQWESQRMVALQQELGVEGERCIACSEQLALLFTSRAFFGEMCLPDQYHFVGVVNNRPAAVGDFDWKWLEARNDQPRVLVSIGTTFDGHQKKDFFEKVAEALGAKPLSVIVVADPAILDNWPENFLVRARVPQLELLPHLDAVLCHGGHNTTCESLINGLPLVVVPIAYDQSYVAGRVVATGCGLRLNFKRLRVADILNSVEEVLMNPVYREAALRVGVSFKEAGGAARAAGLLEEIAEEKVTAIV